MHSENNTGCREVGNVTFTYPANKMFFRRSYCRGFALPVGCVGSAVAGGNLVTTYAPIDQYLVLRIQPRFYAPTSNTYSIDYCFDLLNCWSYLSGVLSPGSIAIEFGTYPPDRNYRIRLGVGLPVDQAQNVDLLAIPGYWRVDPP